MSEAKEAKETKARTSERMLAVKLERAKQEKVPIDLDYDEVTGVIDVALQRGQDCVDAGAKTMRKLVEKLDKAAAPPSHPKPA